MREGWQSQKLGEVTEFIGRGVSPKYIDEGGICVLNQKCIRGHKINYEFSRRHNEALKPVKNDRCIAVGDVLINSTGTGTLGRVAQVKQLPKESTTVDTHVTIVRPIKDKFYPGYFGYLLVGIEDALKAAGEGASGQTELARSAIAEKFSVSFPASIETQKLIADKLDLVFPALDKAIELLRVNAENSKALFKSFLNNIFNDTKVNFEIKYLNQICENLDSKRIPITKSVRNTGVIPYYGASGIVDYVEECIFDEDILLVSEDGANLLGRNYPIAFSVSGKSWVNNHAHVLRFDKLATQKYIEFYLNSIPLNPFVSGMAQPKLNQTMLNKIPIPLPSIDMQEKFVADLERLAESCKQMESSYLNKIEAINCLRNSILNTAINGELTEA